MLDLFYWPHSTIQNYDDDNAARYMTRALQSRWLAPIRAAHS